MNNDIIGSSEQNLENIEVGSPGSTPGNSLDFMSIIKTPTGEGSIDDYINHPINFDETKGLAQMIRGFTGLCGIDLGLALVDIAFGFMRWIRGKRDAAAVGNIS